ncbi:MAG TPA: Ig-like domain-containing protein [Acidobacteriaceae bacterium]|nr:Ig-like domain-containing protein [Acidobacteriaceae bacterium]
MKIVARISLVLMVLTAPAFAAITVYSPANGSTVGTNVPFSATGSTTCAKGVASMAVWVNNIEKYTEDGPNLSVTVVLPAGTYSAAVQQWDYCGNTATVPLTIHVTSSAGVSVSSPASGATVGDPVSFAASATSSCAKGVASMGIYENGQRIYAVSGAAINTQLSLGSGAQQAVVQEWDNCGGSTSTPVNFTVNAGNQISQIQGSGGWNQWGELPPAYDICSSDPCGGVNWSMYQHLTTNSLSGNMSQFNIGGSTPYSDALFSNPVMGQGSAAIPDTARTIIPNVHNFTYDAYVFVTNPAVTEALEFDVNMYLNGTGMEWGTQCDHLADGQWDYWNNVDAKWEPSGAPCNLVYGWNHVTLQVQRESNNDLLYQTITLNGVTYTLNVTVAPFAVSSSWYGVTVNYQMDGNYEQSANTTYLDKFSLTYW